MTGPTRYLHEDPTPKTVVFCDEFIDIKKMAEEEGFNYTYLSHVFSAHSPKFPAHRVGQQIALALGMEYGDFVDALLLKKGRSIA